MTTTQHTTTSTTTPTSPTDYLFDTGSDQGRHHMDLLARVFDPWTLGALDATGVGPGMRCLDVGAGGGSVARWLADRVGPDGAVVAVDLDTTHLTGIPGVSARRHDMNDGLPGALAGPYDLVHARLALMHMPARDEIFAELAASLAPGGWIVVGDLAGRPLSVITAPRADDVAVWERIQHLSHAVVAPAGGIDFEWAGRIDAAMVDHGLTDVQGLEVSRTADGGSPGAQLHATLNLQAADHLLAAGAMPWQMERYQELLADPGFRAWFYRFVCVWGRRPG